MSKATETEMVRQAVSEKTMGKNTALERESLGWRSVVLYSGVFLLVDVWKQVTTYGMKYYNNDHYPLPQTLLVLLGEIFKCVVFLVVLLSHGGALNVKISKWYAIPAVFYAINNNIYLLGLRYCTPPVWNILIQLRILSTAFTYRVFFKRAITPAQWLAVAVLVIAIVLTNFTGGDSGGGASGGGHQNLPMAFLLAALVSVESVIGAVSMEYLFKNDSRSFSDMQFQLYMFTSLAAALLYGMEASTNTGLEDPQAEGGNLYVVVTMVVLCMVLSCLSGIAVGFIVKKLDNIVKLYTQALSNMLTSVACTLLFPDHFTLNLLFACCLLLMFGAIFLYENKNLTLKTVQEKVKEKLCGRKSVEETI